jgi:hypothetical protein
MAKSLCVIVALLWLAVAGLILVVKIGGFVWIARELGAGEETGAAGIFRLLLSALPAALIAIAAALLLLPWRIARPAGFALAGFAVLSASFALLAGYVVNGWQVSVVIASVAILILGSLTFWVAWRLPKASAA